MPKVLSPTSQFLRYVIVAVILILQVASLIVAFNLNSAIISRTDNYATEASRLASTVIGNRIASVRQVLGKVAEDISDKLAQGVPDGEIHRLISEYKQLWNYSVVRLVHYDNGLDLDGEQLPQKEMNLVVRAAMQKKTVMGRASRERSLAYAVPVILGDTLKGVLLVVRGSELAEQLLNIDVFGDTGVTLLIDYNGDILVKNWSTDIAILHEHASFIKEDGKLDPYLFGDDYYTNQTGLWRFDDEHGHEWLVSQNTNEEYGLSLLYAAPVDLLMGGLPSLRWQNLLMHLATFVGTLLLLADIYILQRLYQRKIRNIELTDPLTGGDNTTSFMLKLDKALAQKPGGWVLISMDINKFKLINDEYGVAKANELLRLIHSTIMDSIGQDELCARHTADTFLMLLKHSSEEETRERIEKLMTEIMQRKHSLGLLHKQGLSAGVYVVGDTKQSPYLMLDHTNLAREICKQPPYPSCMFYDESVQEQQRRDADILNFFSRSLENNNFEIWLQPKVNIRTNMVTGAEALVRWNHPMLGFLPPNVFLPVLERNARVAQLDLWVFREVCRLLNRWDREGREIVPIAVNLSRVHLNDSSFLTSYLSLMHEYGIDPHWIELELTENIFVENEEAISNLFSTIRSHGLRCAIDDFGTGYSSLSLLQRAKIDTVKLDRSFFSEEELSTQSKAVIRSITQLSSALGLTCVAEGVENQSTLEFLLSTDCSIAQGYFYSKPLTVEGFEEFSYAADKTCKILHTGFVCHLGDQDRPAFPVRESVAANLLSSMGNIGVYVIKKHSHELLFANEVMKNVTPHIAEGMLCHELWTSHCSNCPLMKLRDGAGTSRIDNSATFGCALRLHAREILWDDAIPAYVVTLIPYSFRDDDDDDDDDDDESLSEEVRGWKKQAQEDSLTNFLNRNQFNIEVKKALDTYEGGALFVIDLDGFKQVNDTYGHQMGDEVLKNTANRIRLSFRKSDILSRYGGDEFLVYAPKLVDRNIIEQRMQTLQGLLRHPHTLEGMSSAVTASIGIAIFPTDGKDLKALAKHADRALYEAKRRGKDQYVIYDDREKASTFQEVPFWGNAVYDQLKKDE